MSKAEERALEAYPIAMSEYSDSCREYDSNESERLTFIEGYHQAEKDLLGNKHERSWRLDENFWKGIKDIEEASYQYMYDASNDWAYDIPTWKDVQDAFKAGSEWKKDLALTNADVYDIWRLYNEVCAEGQIFGFNETSEEVLKRFNEYKEK
jgi:hypothetical protein